ncbi:hypothetical protein GGD41_003598 [Paraburkholderia bryophila]|uniref:Beta-lactamase family protein n=1 Tax=Paraburkholderia bryophila TaxID=420952 RepID=A0A7Z0B192_9BURK|nr:hypothetical protein [Paraburkholderia bryophila]
MTSLIGSIRHALGFTAARRGRERSRESAQHDGERFRNVKPRPVEGLGKTLSIAWNVLVNKPSGTVPTGALPVDTLTRAQIDAAPDRSLYRLGHSTLLLKLRGQFWLTDPVFAERASPFRRLGAEALSCAADCAGRSAAAGRRDPVARSLRPSGPRDGAGARRHDQRVSDAAGCR